MSPRLRRRLALGFTVLLFCSGLIIVGAYLRGASTSHEHVKVIPRSIPASPVVAANAPLPPLGQATKAPPRKDNPLTRFLSREGKSLRAALGPVDRVPARWLLHMQGRIGPSSQDKVLFLGPLWISKGGPESEKPEDRMSWAIMALDKALGETRDQDPANDDILDLLHHPPPASAEGAIDPDVLSAFRLRCCLYLAESLESAELKNVLRPLSSDADPALRGFAQLRLMELNENVDGLAALLVDGSSRTVEVALADLCRSRLRVPSGSMVQGASLGLVCRPVFNHPGIDAHLTAFIGTSPPFDSKTLALDALAIRSENPEALRCLLQVAQYDANPGVRGNALRAMIAIPNNPSVEALLIQTLSRPDVSIEESTKAALAMMSQKSATIAEFLAQRIMAADQDWASREGLALALSGQHAFMSRETRSRLVEFARGLTDTKQREFLLKRIGEFP